MSDALACLSVDSPAPTKFIVFYGLEKSCLIANAHTARAGRSSQRRTANSPVSHAIPISLFKTIVMHPSFAWGVSWGGANHHLPCHVRTEHYSRRNLFGSPADDEQVAGFLGTALLLFRELVDLGMQLLDFFCLRINGLLQFLYN